MARNNMYPPSVKAGIPKLGKKPDGWFEIKIGEVLDVPNRPAIIEDSKEYQLVTAKRSRGGIVPREKLMGKDIKTKTQFYVFADDFLISRRQIIHGACGVVPVSLHGAVVSGEYDILLPVKERLLLDYLAYLSHTDYFQQSCFYSSVGVDVEKMVFRLPQWLDTTFYLPPLAEQRKIAATLGTWDAAIATVEQLAAALQGRKQGLMQRLLTGQVRFAEFAGSEWQDAILEKVLDIQYGKSPSEIRDDEGKYFIWGTGGIVGRTNEIICKGPAILIGRKGTISRPYLIKNPFWAIDTTFFCTPRRDDDIRWIYYYLESIDLTDYNEASGVPSLSRTTLNTITIPMPCDEEQSRIANVLEICDEELSALRKLQIEFQQQKLALMQQLLTGHVRVTIGEGGLGYDL